MKLYIKIGFVSFLLVAFLGLIPGASLASSPNSRGLYKLELTLTIDNNVRRPFIHELIMDRRELNDFEFNTKKKLKIELQKAQEALAIKQGYIPLVYGKDYYKLISIRSWNYKVTELSTDRVVTQGKGL
jgi:hypothetical protein